MTTSIFGSRVLRTEDPRFLTGSARYVEDVPAPGALRAVFVRSIMAHARVNGVDAVEALSMPGVVGVFTAADVPIADQRPFGTVDPELFSRPVLARGVVRFVGEPIAVVVAETREQALDAAESVLVDYEPLPAVADAERALDEGAPVLFPDAGTNVCYRFDHGMGEDPLAGAGVVVRGRFENRRLAPVPLETNAALAVPNEPEGGMTFWVSTQIPFDIRSDVAEMLGVEKDLVRVVAPDVGGGFGAKVITYPEHLLVAWVANRLGRPVRWIDSRSESMTALTHGRGQVQQIAIGATRQGEVVGIDVRVVADMGAYPSLGVYLPPLTLQMSTGVYRIPKVRFDGLCVVTNTTPISAYRGAGRPEAAAMIERAMDMLAVELELDPVELRRRNLIPRDAFPLTTPGGSTYDVGDYELALDEALRLAGYEELRGEQAKRRSRGDHLALGIGLATYVETTGGRPGEFARVEVAEDGGVTVRSGLTSTGQGHETALAQLAAELLGVELERVRVIHSDTAAVERGEGTYGSRSLQVGGTAVWQASEAVVEKARRIAAHVLEAAVEDVEVTGEGGVGVRGAPERAVGWGELARLAADPGALPEGVEPGMSAQVRFRPSESTYPFGAHVAVVEVDTETGDARLVRHVAVDDCGRILNPILVEGQVHGGLAQGIAQALYEEVVFDEDGNPLTSTLATYGIPSAADLPSFETGHTETPTPINPLGAKGIGESATIGSTPAVQNAVVDALSHLGVRHVDIPCTPERVWSAIRTARERGSAQM